METSPMSGGDTHFGDVSGGAFGEASRMDELSRMLGDPSGQHVTGMNVGQATAGAGGSIAAGGGDGGMGGGAAGTGEHSSSSSSSGSGVKAEPALGAAALERVMAAAKAAHDEQQRCVEDQRAVCDLCNVRRADLRGPCGHKYHARCIYSMPIVRCPVCDMDFGNDDGLFILPVEPYAATNLFEEDERKGRDAEHQSRTGRWHSYETMYAQRIVADFDAGTMPLSEGTKLGNFLCNILNCSPSRLSKKLKIGKKYFQRCPPTPLTEKKTDRSMYAQQRPSDLEEMFLMAESQTNRGVANTQILSECIQKEWRERFIGHAHTVNQKLKNAWDWNSSRRKAELSSDAFSKLLSSITPSKGEQGMGHLAPLMLVSQNGDNNNGNQGQAGGGAQGQGTHNVSLAQAMGNVIQSWQQGHSQHGMQRFPSANGDQQPQAGGASGLSSSSGAAGSAVSSSSFGGGGGGVSSCSSSSSHQQQQAFLSAMTQQRGGAGAGFSWLEQQTGHQQRHGQGAPQMQGSHEGMDDMEGFGEELWSSLENNLASMGYQNSVAIEDMDQDLTNQGNGQWTGGLAQGQGPLGEKTTAGTSSTLDEPQLFIGGNGSNNLNTAGGPGVVTLRDAGRGNPGRPAWQPSTGGNMGGGGNGNGNGGGNGNGNAGGNGAGGGG
ncbi:unnamed protein product, partial [Ectocarpus sp. 4 AP-2014]